MLSPDFLHWMILSVDYLCLTDLNVEHQDNGTIRYSLHDRRRYINARAQHTVAGWTKSVPFYAIRVGMACAMEHYVPLVTSLLSLYHFRPPLTTVLD